MAALTEKQLRYDSYYVESKVDIRDEHETILIEKLSYFEQDEVLKMPGDEIMEIERDMEASQLNYREYRSSGNTELYGKYKKLYQILHNKKSLYKKMMDYMNHNIDIMLKYQKIVVYEKISRYEILKYHLLENKDMMHRDNILKQIYNIVQENIKCIEILCGLRDYKHMDSRLEKCFLNKNIVLQKLVREKASSVYQNIDACKEETNFEVFSTYIQKIEKDVAKLHSYYL
jgi:hypothetical protein